ncbi:hypothetical protein GKZ89_16815 [Bacillus mangrovi]|uniref:Uncharacterized protein n=1 Tax=Metabacillus mangrovi TaxID=1491830 RepID=A0A7X2S7H5_9BACI|nr:hypothetical protein [Metabacillus mangrovi]MTH55068.1 hypothetical protein [Metabacillus mangrovi]
MSWFTINKTKSLYKLLETDYAIGKFDYDDVYFYHKNSSGSADLETGYVLVQGSPIKLCKVQRDYKTELAEFHRGIIALLALYLLTVSRKSSFPSRDEMKKLLERDEINIHSAEMILKNVLKSGSFSVGEEKRNRIIMEAIAAGYRISYINESNEKLLIADKKLLNQAMLVMCHYGLLIEEFECLLSKWRKKLNITEEEEEVLRKVYLGK